MCSNPNTTEAYSQLVFSQQSQSPFSWLSDGAASANTISMSLESTSGSAISVAELPAAGELELWLDTQLAKTPAQVADLEGRIITGHTVFPDNETEMTIHKVKVESGATLVLNVMHNVLFSDSEQNESSPNTTVTINRRAISDGLYIGL